MALRYAQAEGQGEVVAELREGRNPRFDEFRNDPVLKKLIQGVQPTELSPTEGLYAARRIIKLTSELRDLLSPKMPTMVSAACDCAAIDSSTGFSWLR